MRFTDCIYGAYVAPVECSIGHNSGRL